MTDRDNLILANTGLVITLTNRMYHDHLLCERDDLEGAGFLGLCKAADTWDAWRGTRFSTYATRCIRNEIIKLLRDQLPNPAPIMFSDLPQHVLDRMTADTPAPLPLDLSDFYAAFPPMPVKWLNCWIRHKLDGEEQAVMAPQYGVSRQCMSAWVCKAQERILHLISIGEITVDI